jgi:hypothetical protein
VWHVPNHFITECRGENLFLCHCQRLTKYLLEKKFIDIAIQKGGILGFSGCLKHTTMLSKLIQEAKINHTDLALIRLDLAYAYGSIPYNLVKLALGKYRAPQNLEEMISQYFDKLQVRFSVADVTTSWQRLEKGIITCCTISVILFVAAFNILLKFAEGECRGPKIDNGMRLPPIRAFMDDIIMETNSLQGARWILNALYRLADWARM